MRASSGAGIVSHGRRLAGDALVYGLAYAVSRGISFLLLPIYTRFLGVAEYGAFDVVLSFNRALMVPASLGLDSGLGLVLQESSGQDQRRRATSALIAQTVWLLILTVGVGMAAPGLSRWLFGTVDRTGTLRIALVLLAVQVLFNFTTGVLKWKREPWRFLTMLLGGALASGAGSVIAVVWLQGGSAGAISGLLIGSALFLPVGLILIARHLAPAFTLSNMRRCLALGLPFALAGAAELIFPLALRLILLDFGGLEAVGVFAAANTICLAIVMANYAFSGAWFPFALSPEGRRLRSEWPRVLTLYGFSLILVAAAIALLAPLLVSIVLGGGVYVAATRLFAPIALAYWIKAMRQESGAALMADGSSWAYSVFGAGAIAAMLAFAWAMSQPFGLEGAAWGMATGEACAFAAQSVFARRRGGSVFGVYSAGVMGIAFALLALATLMPSFASTGMEIAMRVGYGLTFIAVIVIARGVPVADILHAGMLLRSLTRRQ